MFFLRDTENPLGDLRRGFSGNVNAWFETEDEAAVWAAANGSIAPPAQCPVSKEWCGDPEPGLSGFAFAGHDDLAAAASRIAQYVSGDKVHVFRTSDWDAAAGMDAEDCFRNPEYMFELPYPVTTDAFENALSDWKFDHYERGYCHVLALALHKATGWELCALLDHGDPWDDETPTVVHVTVCHPSGGLVDINGLCLQDRMLMQHTVYEPEFIYPTEDELRAFVGEERPLVAWTDRDWAMAVEDAEEVLRLEPEWQQPGVGLPVSMGI